MRTTVTIDPDVEALLKSAVRESGEPFKKVLNNALRQGLSSPPSKREKRFKQRSFNLGRPLVDLTKALTLAGELEDADRIAKMHRRQSKR